VFSTGILTLALVATVITVALGANVHRLIPLYAVGVFASFTFSQAGMTRRHLRLREVGWRRSLIINGLGAIGSGAALIAIAVSKFAEGAWVVFVLVPLGVALFLAIHRHYERTDRLLADLGAARFARAVSVDVVVLLSELDTTLESALQYVDRLPNVGEVRLLHVGRPRGAVEEASRRTGRPIEVKDPEGATESVVRAARHGGGPRAVAAVVPYLLDEGPRHQPVRVTRLEARSLDSDAFVIMLPVHQRSRRLDPVPVRRATVVVIDRLDVTAVEGVRVASLIGDDEIHAVHFDVDHDETDWLVERWPRAGLGIDLQILAAEYPAPDLYFADFLADLRAHGIGFVTVVIPELVPRWWQRPLYDRTARMLRAVLAREPDTATVVVPHRLPSPSPARQQEAARVIGHGPAVEQQC
jgi:hypothetical protein